MAPHRGLCGLGTLGVCALPTVTHQVPALPWAPAPGCLGPDRSRDSRPDPFHGDAQDPPGAVTSVHCHPRLVSAGSGIGEGAPACCLPDGPSAASEAAPSPASAPWAQIAGPGSLATHSCHTLERTACRTPRPAPGLASAGCPHALSHSARPPGPLTQQIRFCLPEGFLTLTSRCCQAPPRSLGHAGQWGAAGFQEVVVASFLYPSFSHSALCHRVAGCCLPGSVAGLGAPLVDSGFLGAWKPSTL